MGSESSLGVVMTPLKIIHADGGNVLHGLKCGEAEYKGFGEAYFSWINPDMIKAWKRHKRMTMNLVVPVGRVRFVFRNEENNTFMCQTLGSEFYNRLTVPPGIWFGFQNLAAEPSLVLNMANMEHDPDEVDRKNLDAFVFDWSQ